MSKHWNSLLAAAALGAAIPSGYGLDVVKKPRPRYPDGEPRPRRKAVLNTPEIEAWNEAVDAAKAEKKTHKRRV